MDKTWVRTLKHWMITLFIAVNIALIIKTYVFNIAIVSGHSMFPTLNDGDRLITNNVSVVFKNYERGDIVILEAPYQEGKLYIKRIIGLPGDIIRIEGGKVFLNGEELEENYINTNFTHYYKENEWIVPPENVFVLGDNREKGASNDSRYFGYVPINALKGMPVIKFYPWNSFSTITKDSLSESFLF